MSKEMPEYNELLKRVRETNDKYKAPEKNTSCILAIFIFLFGICSAFGNLLILSFTVHTLWKWLIYPFVDYSPEFMLILGSYMVFSVYQFKVNLANKNYKFANEDTFIIFFAVLFFCSLTLGIGWVCSLFV